MHNYHTTWDHVGATPPERSEAMDQHEREVRFEQLVSIYSQDLFRYALWLCRDKVMAEEVVQETYTRAWRNIHKIRDPKASKSWLITILRREHARQFERKRPQYDDLDPGLVAEAKPEYDTSTEAFVLRRALAKLPEEYREPLMLQVIGGYSCDEIAQELGISSAAVMTRLFRARQKMRTALTEDGED